MASSSEAGGDVVDMTMEGEDNHEEEEEDEVVEGAMDAETDDGEREEKQEDVVEIHSDDQREEEEEDVQFMGSVERINGHQEAKQEEEGEVVIVEGQKHPRQERSRANTNALLAANGFVTPATLEAELQCIICQYAMFKPVTALCGHSFCRVCLMDSFLTRPIEEAQCPICRVEILQHISAKTSLVSIFSINVTLWNLVQLLIPSVAERISSYQQEEEQEFTQKLDQLYTKWKVFTLNERAARYHGDHDEEDAERSGRWEEDHEGHNEYPVVKVEDTHDGNLHVSRNVVLDTNDENEDGYVNMRVGIAIVEFPSIFELYNEHQECSVNVIKMEEDEEMADGMPFFMNEDGDDDGFVCSAYYNEISLRVCDEAGNCVMERTRGAQSGVVTFPGLRLDVPGGLYTFRFSDDLYGLKLSITTRLREPHEISDTPVADYVSLIHDEARDSSRRNRRRQHDSDDEDRYDEGGNESDDSFIVDDLTGRNEQPVGRFSDDEGEDHWDYRSDDEAADEEREQRRVRRRQQSGRRSERDVQFVDEQEDLSDQEEEHESSDIQEDADDQEENDEEEEDVWPGRRNVQVVDAAFSSDGEADYEEHDTIDAAEGEGKGEEDMHDTHEVARPRRRNANQIVDSEDEDEGSPDGNDEEQKDDIQHSDDCAILAATVEGHDSEDDDTIPRPATRKVKRKQWFQSEESDNDDTEAHPDAVFSPDEDEEVPDRRPRKRSRARGRQVLVVESEEEQEEVERSIAAANSEHALDDEDADDDEGDESQFRRVHVYDEEVDDDHDEAQLDEDDAPDYPDEEENDYQGEQGDYY